MVNKNQPPRNPEHEPSSLPELVRYNDGQLALEFGNKGDRINLSRHKYGDVYSPNPSTMVLVETITGNIYALSQCVGINTQEQNAFLLSDNLPGITIGEPWNIPDIGSTDNVNRVALRYKIDRSLSTNVDKDIDLQNPFDQYDELIDQTLEQFSMSYRDN